MMEVDADRAAAAGSSSRQRAELAEGEAGAVALGERPVDGDRDLDEALDIERRVGVVAREDTEAELGEQLGGRPRAPVPRRRERRLGEPGQHLLEDGPAFDDVAALVLARSPRPELGLAARRLAVRVREAVLVNSEPSAGLADPP